MTESTPESTESTTTEQEESPATTTNPPLATASEAMIIGALGEVYDPEIGIDIVSLGLVYGADVDDAGLLTIRMTLTSPMCPLGSLIETQAHAVCAPLPGVQD